MRISDWSSDVCSSDLLATKYRARYGEAPFRLSALGYDAVLLTVRIAQDWKVGTPFPARKLADPDGFSGIAGAFRFNSTGVAERALEVQQVNAGKFSVIDPAPKRFGRSEEHRSELRSLISN